MDIRECVAVRIVPADRPDGRIVVAVLDVATGDYVRLTPDGPLHHEKIATVLQACAEVGVEVQQSPWMDEWKSKVDLPTAEEVARQPRLPPSSQACQLGYHHQCPGENTLGTSKCKCECHEAVRR